MDISWRVQVTVRDGVMAVLWELVPDLYSPALKVMEVCSVDFPLNTVLLITTEQSHRVVYLGLFEQVRRGRRWHLNIS